MRTQTLTAHAAGAGTAEIAVLLPEVCMCRADAVCSACTTVPHTHAWHAIYVHHRMCCTRMGSKEM